MTISDPIFAGRIQLLRGGEGAKGDYVLYWMQQSQRARWNHALEYAVLRANASGLPLVVCFGLTAGYPEANLRHYTFLLEGLADTARALEKRGARFVLRLGEPDAVALALGKKAALIVCDRGYLRHQKAWRRRVAREARCPVEQVESDVIVPVNIASDKAEYAARTLRPKLQRVLEEFLRPVRPAKLKQKATRLKLAGEPLDDPAMLLRKLKLDRSVGDVSEFFRGGTGVAEKIFRKFLREKFADYREHRNQPQTNDVSHMSKYLHFGQISPLWLAWEARRAGRAGRQNVYSFIDELLVRRELSMNWCEFNEKYDDYASLPDWARTTLAEHRNDKRPHRYRRAELEAAKTHDEYWNAAMREMTATGYMHNYMRMYWGKKILEWSKTPEEAHAVTLALNNKYFLDGRDANSFANVAWVFGQHDRPWGEREIFGKVRYMNARGLERKCDIKAYVEKVEKLSRRSAASGK